MTRLVAAALALLLFLPALRAADAPAAPKPLPPAAGDPERVMQLLANLIGNALKYNKSPDSQVVIGALPDDGTASVTLFVRDNGDGIEPQYHEQIFKMFRRLHRREDVEGTGAGLAICKKIVEAHGGRLWVESEPGKGATFFFTLPKSQRHQHENTKERKHERKS